MLVTWCNSNSDRNKSRARDRYLVVSVDPRFVTSRSSLGPSCAVHHIAWSYHNASGSQSPRLTPQLPLDAIVKTLLMKMTYSRSRTLHRPHMTFLMPSQCPPSKAAHPLRNYHLPLLDLLPTAVLTRPPTMWTYFRKPPPEPVEVNPSSDDGPRRTSRSRHPPACFVDYVTDFWLCSGPCTDAIYLVLTL